MAEAIQLGDTSITIRRRANARRLTLRISPDGPVMTLPRRMPLAEAERFARSKRDWIEERLARIPAPDLVGIGSDLPFEGETLRVTAGEGRGCKRIGATLEVGGRADTAPARIAGFLKAEARDRLADAVDYYAREVRRPVGRLTLRDTRSRWGSCTSRGDLMFSWRLILAPPEVLDYVAAHEVAHLVEMNHSDRFWAEVARILPDYARPRAWLREKGPELHRYRFA